MCRACTPNGQHYSFSFAISDNVECWPIRSRLPIHRDNVGRIHLSHFDQGLSISLVPFSRGCQVEFPTIGCCRKGYTIVQVLQQCQIHNIVGFFLQACGCFGSFVELTGRLQFGQGINAHQNLSRFVMRQQVDNPMIVHGFQHLSNATSGRKRILFDKARSKPFDMMQQCKNSVLLLCFLLLIIILIVLRSSQAIIIERRRRRHRKCGRLGVA
mmetsp:Transcript_4904/g.11668  ORF Transcript_4904/g.11668 Transcript_4904/m.11668 type:complete len:213 (+) Transcript_4904:761-1399(+)